MKSLAQARIGRPFKGDIELMLTNGAGAFVLPQTLATYRLRLYHHSSTAHFAEASIANGKMTITVTAASTLVSFSFPDTDMALATKGYGSMELVSTIDNEPVVQPPVMYLDETMPYTAENGEKLAIFQEKIVCVLTSSVVEYILGGTTVVVNVLPAGSAGSGSYTGSPPTLTLNLPKGDQGSNGVLSVAEVARGTLAMERLGMIRPSRKAVLVDGAGGGVAGLDDTSGHVLASIENYAGLTNTRASTGRFLARSRVLTTAAANALRLHHLADGTPAGLLIEEGRSNLARQSQTLDTTWTTLNATVTANTATAPDGTATGDLITETAITGQHRVAQTVTGTTSAANYCLSAYVKAGSRNKVFLMRGTAANAVFDLAAGTVFSNSGASFVTAGIRDQGNGWYRIWLVDNAALTSFACQIGLADAAGAISYLGDGASNASFWGVQLELGTQPTSYVDTTTAAVARAADVLMLPVSGFAIGNGISLLAEFIMPFGAGPATIVEAYGNSASILAAVATGTSLSIGYYRGANYLATFAGLTPGNRYCVACSFDSVTSRLKAKCTGQAAQDNAISVSSLGVNPVSLNLGSQNGASQWLNGPVNFAALLDRAMDASEIAAFTG